MDKEKELAMIELPDLTTEKPMKLEVGVTYKGSFKLSNNLERQEKEEAYGHR